MPTNYYISQRKCGVSCGTNDLSQPKICDTTVWTGRVNGLSFIPCSETFDPTTLSDLTKWQTWFDINNPIGKYIRGGFGSIGQNEIRTTDIGSENGEEVSEIQWKLSWTQKSYDMVDLTTHQFINELIRGGYKAFNLVAHPVKELDMIIPIGKFVAKIVDDIHPEDVKTEHSTKIDFIWTPVSLSIPTPITTVGISSVITQW